MSSSSPSPAASSALQHVSLRFVIFRRRRRVFQQFLSQLLLSVDVRRRRSGVRRRRLRTPSATDFRSSTSPSSSSSPRCLGSVESIRRRRSRLSLHRRSFTGVFDAFSVSFSGADDDAARLRLESSRRRFYFRRRRCRVFSRPVRRFRRCRRVFLVRRRFGSRCCCRRRALGRRRESFGSRRQFPIFGFGNGNDFRIRNQLCLRSFGPSFGRSSRRLGVL